MAQRFPFVAHVPFVAREEHFAKITPLFIGVIWSNSKRPSQYFHINAEYGPLTTLLAHLHMWAPARQG